MGPPASSTSNTRRGEIPPTSIASSGFAPRERKIIIASEWYFLPLGVSLVKQRLRKDLEAMRMAIQCDWIIEDQVFRVICLTGEVESIWLLLHDIIRTVVRDECGRQGLENLDQSSDDDDESDEDVPIKSDKILPLALWKKQNGITDDNEEQPSGESPLKFPELVNDYEAKNIWLCTASTFCLDDIASDENLMELSRLTGCQFVKALNEGKLYIGAQSQKQCHLAMSKLDNICKYWQVDFTLHNIFYNEEFEKARVVLKLFKVVKNKYFETTLLDNLQLTLGNHYNNLEDAMTVRCAPWNPISALYKMPKDPKIFPTTEEQNKDLEPRDWINFTYCSKGEQLNYSDEPVEVACNSLVEKQIVPPPATVQAEDSALAQLLPANVLDPASTIKKWVTEVPAPEPEQLVPLDYGKLSSLQGSTVQQAAVDKPQSKPAWDTYTEYGYDYNAKAKGEDSKRRPNQLVVDKATLRGVAQQQSTSTQDELPKSAPQPVLRQQAAMDMPSSISLGQTQPKTQRVEPKPIKMVFSDEVGQGLSGFFNHSIDKPSILDDDISMLGSFSVLKPVRNSSAQMQSNLTENIPLRQVTVPPIYQNFPEVQQAVSEVSTRTFRQTMNQKAAKRNPYAGRLELPSPLPTKTSPAKKIIEVIDPHPDFKLEMNASFEAMMKNVRGFRGELMVQLNFGRIIVRNIGRKFLSTKEADNCLEVDELQRKLSYPEPTVFFTQILTSVPADIHFLLDMQDANGEQLWTVKPISWSVKYEFEYHIIDANNWVPFTVEMDAETFTTRIKTRRALGSVFVYGTRRYWDFNMSATGFETSDGNDEKYGVISDALKVSLQIPAGANKPSLAFEMSTLLCDNYQLDGIRVRRVCRYKSKDEKSILMVSELQDLDVNTKAMSPDVQAFRAFPNASVGTGSEKLNSWFEVSISCSQANERFEENKKLELGDEAGWTPETLSGMDAAEAMYLPACQMLKKMDGVGFYNKNGVNVRTTPSSFAESAVSAQPLMDTVDSVVFW